MTWVVYIFEGADDDSAGRHDPITTGTRQRRKYRELAPSAHLGFSHRPKLRDAAIDAVIDDVVSDERVGVSISLFTKSPPMNQTEVPRK